MPYRKYYIEGWKTLYFLGKFFLEIQFTAQTKLFELEILNTFRPSYISKNIVHSIQILLTL